MATRAFVQQGTSLGSTFRVFNALLTLSDARGEPQPELLSSLPALNTDSWQVFPDGTMQTTYTLRPNLTWHDGEPLTSDDFVFAWRVYSSPELGISAQPPLRAMGDVSAIDREHFAISWKAPYPDAANLSSRPTNAFPPRPRHILGTVLDQMATGGRESFAGHPFWGPQYVGLGPYRLQQWEPGSFIAAVRFERYALGAPKIERIELRFSGDPNASIASLLAGEAHIATSDAIGHAPDPLKEQWARTGGTTLGETVLVGLASSQIPTPANRWQGFNRGGWSSPDYDRFIDAFNTTLDRGQRVGLVRQLLRVYSEELPWVSLLYRTSNFACVAAVKGPVETRPESNVLWNVHQWELN